VIRKRSLCNPGFIPVHESSVDEQHWLTLAEFRDVHSTSGRRWAVCTPLIQAVSVGAGGHGRHFGL